MHTVVEFSVLKGKTLSSIDVEVVEPGDNCIKFTTTDGLKYEMYHANECCEDVFIESIVGDLQDLIGQPILLAEEVTNREEDGAKPIDADAYASSGGDYSYTWTFYKLATVKGYVDIRWYGSSNGYYSEDVQLHLVD